MSTTTTEKKDECVELKNIKYKTMLMSGNVIQETKTTNNMNNLENFLENEKITNKAEPWAKLDKTVKIQKLLVYAESYAKEKEYNEDEKNNLIRFLKDSLDRKKLQRVKDVVYEKITGEVKEIPGLVYNKSNNHFTLKNLDSKRVSTLKSLPPKKVKGTLKNIVENEDPDDE
jgi:NADPH-dependent 7-cyano-7-deazaguanine reductase QueF